MKSNMVAVVGHFSN